MSHMFKGKVEVQLNGLLRMTKLRLRCQNFLRDLLVQETVGGPHVEKTLNVVVPNHVQSFVGSSYHEGFQENTHYSYTPGSLS